MLLLKQREQRGFRSLLSVDKIDGKRVLGELYAGQHNPSEEEESTGR